jgi:hypothetical protein
MKKIILVLVALGLLAVPAAVIAGQITYGYPGTINPVVYSFTAASTGQIVGYFYGYDAAYGSDVALVLSNVSQGYSLYNKVTAVGDSVVMGNVNAGDILEFTLRVNTSGGDPASHYDYILSSNPINNSDSKNHVYATAWSAGDVPGTSAYIPDGEYIAFEDLTVGNGPDWDYNDHQFVFTNVGSVPDGGSTLALLGAALAGIGLIRRKLS